MTVKAGAHLPVKCIWLSAFYNLPAHVPEVAYVIQVELEDMNAVADAVTLLQSIASMVGEGEGMPLGNEGPQYGALVYRDERYPIVRLSHRTWTEEMANAAQSVICTIANRHRWLVRRG